MTDTPSSPPVDPTLGRPRGPWDPAPGTATIQPEAPPADPAAPALDKGQHPAVALISTLLLAGFVWWLSGSWIVAVALVFGLFVHEYGHVLAMNRYGMGPAKIYIIPFLGGLARGQRMPSSEWHGVLVSLAGPAFGLLAALPFFALFYATGETRWLGGVLAIAFINLINLAPAPPLDGAKALGPVLARIHPVLEWLALLAVGGLAVAWGIWNGSFIFAVFLGLSLFAHLRRGRWRPEGRALTWREAGLSFGLFLLTALACAAVGVLGILPVADGSLDASVAQGGRMLGIGR